MPDLQQTDRGGQLTTPLGDNTLVLVRFDGAEGLGELFEFHVEALSETENLSFDGALARSCTVTLDTYEDKQRHFDGVLAQAQWIGRTEEVFHYRLVLRPWTWLLGHRADCRIFLDKSVTDIIREVFEKAGFSNGQHFEFRTTGSYDPIKYCVQYRETDLAFTMRLMEEFGLYFFYEHAAGKHTMVLADSHASHQTIGDLSEVPYRPVGGRYVAETQHLIEWVAERRFRTGKVQYNDYDYLSPGKDLKAPKQATATYAHADYEVYDYPGRYVDLDKGKSLAQFRLEAEQAMDHRRLTGGEAPSLYPGGLTTTQELTSAEENREFLCLRASHRFAAQHYRSGYLSGDTEPYAGSYEFLPSDRPFRMLPHTPRPRIHGIQTALVVGDQGEEITTDEHGHIWVQFYWDREPKKSCPVRVAQPWAGKNWGHQFIPRIGMEVVVEFLEGDPDRPLVTGAVYNGDNEVPYALDDNKTQSGVKSDSSKGHNGYNEIMFEDKKGDEFIRMHAEKDHKVKIKNDETGQIGDNQTWEIGNNRTVTIDKGNDALTLTMGNQTITLTLGTQTVDALMGITLSVCMGLSTIEITPAAISMSSPMVNITAMGAVNITAPAVNIGAVVTVPTLIAGAGLVGGLPLI